METSKNMAHKEERNYSTLAIEKKESFRWISTVQSSKQVLEDAKHKIVITDREGDIYPLYTRLNDANTDIIVRSGQNRRLVGEKTIKEYLQKAIVKMQFNLNVKANKKETRSRHTAIMEMKFGEIELIRPKRASSKETDKSFKMFIVQVKESKRSVKKGETPIEWTLLTTIPIKNNKDGQQIINYYSKRWMVEEFFAILKTRGLNLENSQLTNGEALMKLCIVAMDVAIKILQLTKGRENEELSAELVFSKEEIKILDSIISHYEGSTHNQKNLFKKKSLAWAAWVIGRMGGWTGYKADSPPGNKTMKRGLDKFNIMFSYHSIMKKDVCRD